MQNDYYMPYQYHDTPEKQQRTRDFLKSLLAVIVTLSLIAFIVLATIQILQKIHAENPGGSHILLEFDGTEFHFYDTYGKIIREIAAERPLYDYGGVYDTEVPELTDIDGYLSQTIAEGEKNLVMKRDPNSSIPGLIISVGKNGFKNTDYTTKLEDAHTRIIIYPFGSKKTQIAIDGHPFTTGESTSKDLLEAFPEAQEMISEDSSSSSGNVYMLYYKNRYIYASFSAKDALAGLELIDFKLY